MVGLVTSWGHAVVCGGGRELGRHMDGGTSSLGSVGLELGSVAQ